MKNKEIIEFISENYSINTNVLKDFKSIKKEVLERLQNGAFVSFSQNYEDVILRRIFKLKKKGTFVDVGAFHPFYNSNTYYFYNLGWRGINIDMDEGNIKEFTRLRNEDLNLQTAISNKNESIETYLIKNSSRSSIFEDIANINLKKDEVIVKTNQEAKTLNTILENSEVKDIDFISIDVEGAEDKVLEGFSIEKYLPKIIIIESVFPQTNKIKSYKAENLLLDNDYHPFYFDGINKFYCNEKNLEKYKCYVGVPPNYFDNFIRFKDILGMIDY